MPATSIVLRDLSKEEFFGRSVSFYRGSDAEPWITAELCAPMLGMKRRLGVAKLFRSKSEFVEGSDFVYASLDAGPREPNCGSCVAEVAKRFSAAAGKS